MIVGEKRIATKAKKYRKFAADLEKATELTVYIPAIQPTGRKAAIFLMEGNKRVDWETVKDMYIAIAEKAGLTVSPWSIS